MQGGFRRWFCSLCHLAVRIESVTRLDEQRHAAVIEEQLEVRVEVGDYPDQPLWGCLLLWLPSNRFQ